MNKRKQHITIIILYASHFHVIARTTTTCTFPEDCATPPLPSQKQSHTSPPHSAHCDTHKLQVKRWQQRHLEHAAHTCDVRHHQDDDKIIQHRVAHTIARCRGQDSSGAIPRRHHDRPAAPKFQQKNTRTTFTMIALTRFVLVLMFIRQRQHTFVLDTVTQKERLHRVAAKPS